MDQKEIDALLNKGTFDVLNEKQDQIIKNLADKKKPPAPEPAPTRSPAPPNQTEDERIAAERKGKVMGQISKVTEESEAGTNLVMGFMESVLNTVSMQQKFIKDIRNKYHEAPQEVNFDEVLMFMSDSFNLIEEHIFSAMDAFQFQDIGRQKLMKVMYTLAKLNEYLNELLGGETERTREFGHEIERKTLEHDKDKVNVDNIVADFHGNENGADSANDTVNNDDINNLIANFQQQEQKAAPSTVSNDDVGNIVANFQKQEEASSQAAPTTVSNDDINDLVANFQKQEEASSQAAPTTVSNDDINDLVANFQKQEEASSQAAPTTVSNDDINDLVANFKKQEEKSAPTTSTTVSNDDMDSIIAEFKKNNP